MNPTTPRGEPPPMPPIRDSRLVALWRHWLAARGKRTMPPRRVIEPAAIAPTLAHLFVYDYHADTGRFFCRLAGEEIYAAAGIHGARRFLEDIFQSPTLERVHERYRRVVATPGIIYTNGMMRVASGYLIPGERLILPLSDDGRTANGLVGATIYRRNEGLPPDRAIHQDLAPEELFALPPA